jgi:3',5'-cyclic AMP phosphodiesterase CpdA
VQRVDGLVPDRAYDLYGIEFRTLPVFGELLCRFATVNDVHFGETECGIVEGLDIGPVLARPPGQEPHPELMSRGAIAEITAIDPAVVLVKGDLTSDGTLEQYERFLSFYEPPFGDRLVHVRGNHESYPGGDLAAIPTQEVVLPGVHLALIDTSAEARAGGIVHDEQLDWLDDLAGRADRPILLFGHHHPWSPDSRQRPQGYFGIEPDSSQRLVDLVARHPGFHGYFCGHTHRNRVRWFGATGALPWAEVASVKDFPGVWAEYRVYEGGTLQIVHRVSDPEALEWTEQTRQMFAGTYGPYAQGRLGERCFAITGER